MNYLSCNISALQTVGNMFNAGQKTKIKYKSGIILIFLNFYGFCLDNGGI